MDVRLTLNPGDRGTKKLIAIYGDKLVCVRYRYDKASRRRYKTVELIIDTVPWKPPRKEKPRVVGVKIKFSEKELQLAVKNAGGKWNKEQKLWMLPFNDAVKLGLKNRIAGDA
jgi:hypothetical protein